MYANNESGAIQPVQEIAAIARDRGIPLHTDAVQAAGMLPLSVDALGVDLAVAFGSQVLRTEGRRAALRAAWYADRLSADRVGARSRAGAAERRMCRESSGLAWRWNARTAGAMPTPNIVRDCGTGSPHGLFAAIPEATLNGPSDPWLRLPNNLNVTIPGIQGETLLLSLDVLGVAASAGSACTTGNTEPSHVLRAMGLSDDACRSALRFTVGRSNTEEQIDEAIDALVDRLTGRASLAGSAAI